MNTPQHIIDKATNDPRITVLEYTYERVLPPLDAVTVASYVKVIRTEFMKLLCQSSNSDAEIRERLKTHKPFFHFADRYSTLFTMITRREIVTSNALMSVVYFQVYVLEKVQKKEMTESEAQAAIAKVSFEALTREIKSQSTNG